MNSNIQNSQDYSDLPMYQTENTGSLAPINNNGDQHASINNVRMSNTTTSALRNDTFEFYFPLPNDRRIYYVTYTELNPLENARLLNNSINLSRVPNNQLPNHYSIQSLIRQQIQQYIQQPVYQQNNDQQQLFDSTTQPAFQVYSDNNNNNNAYNIASNSVNGIISDNIKDIGFQDSF